MPLAREFSVEVVAKPSRLRSAVELPSKPSDFWRHIWHDLVLSLVVHRQSETVADTWPKWWIHLYSVLLGAGCRKDARALLKADRARLDITLL